MSDKTILVVDDEEDLRELVSYNLKKSGYAVLEAPTGEAALRMAARERPDLIILDVLLPGIDGLEVCRLLRQKEETRDVPIIMLTAKVDETDIIVGLELGADDYVTKPFSPKVLMSRVKAVLRRKAAGHDERRNPVRIADLMIDPNRHLVEIAGESISMTYSEFKLLHALASRPGWVFTRGQLVEALRGQEYAVTDRAIDVHIVNIRKKLGERGGLIETVRSVGYRFKE